MKKTMSWILSLTLCLSLLLPIAATAEDDKVIGPFERYPETIVVNGYCTNPRAIVDDGITENGNLYEDYLLKRSNIKVNILWTVDQANYDNKIAMAIASGDLPDIFAVHDMATLRTLIENDMIEDLTGTYETKAANFLKVCYESYGDEAFTTGVFDGKLMAVPDLNYGYQYAGTWIRKDWLDKLGLEMPKTLDDLVNDAQAFVDNNMSGNNDTVGFMMLPEISGVYNASFVMDPILNYMNAYPRNWVVQDDGTVAYGSVLPEYKEALGFLADLYKRDLIDSQFATRTDDERASMALNGRCGIVFGPWWYPDWPIGNAKVIDPNVDWQPLLVPLSEDGKAHPVSNQVHKAWMVVRKGFEHPEIVWEMINYAAQDRATGDDYIQELRDISAFYKEKLGNDVVVQEPWRSAGGGLMIQEAAGVRAEASIIRNVLENNITDLSGLKPNAISFLNRVRPYTEGDPSAWGAYTTVMLGAFAFTDDSLLEFKKIYYPAPTETMTLMWTNLLDMESEMTLKIIMGKQDISTFDEFVANWKALGGSQITGEVNEAYKESTN